MKRLIKPRDFDGRPWQSDYARAYRQKIREEITRKLEVTSSITGRELPDPEVVEDHVSKTWVEVCAEPRDPGEELGLGSRAARG